MKGFKPFPFLALSVYLCVLTACGSSHPPNGPGALNIANPSLPEGVVQSRLQCYSGAHRGARALYLDAQLRNPASAV